LIASGNPLIMGILNVTPDSFSDGGRHNDLSSALNRAQAMCNEGAEIIDIGGESTRPGAEPVDADSQLSRVIPVIQGLCSQSFFGMPRVISIDTTRSEVAAAAVTAGASLVNDVSAGTDDPRMFQVVARLDVPIVLMHRLGSSKTMQDNPNYMNVVEEVIDCLRLRAECALAEGISKNNIVVDPGIGFGKTRLHNLQLISHLHRLVTELGYPVLLGASRKRFMGALCQETEPDELLGATVATTVMGVLAGVRIFRVHDVKANRQAATVTHAVMAA
jgi:dihydropteroate synthase